MTTLRFEFTSKQQKEIRRRSGDVCEAGIFGTHALYGMAPGDTCKRKAAHIDHIVADGLKRSKPTSIDEGAHVCLAHHKIKTAGDVKKIAKAKRINNTRAGIRKPAARIPSRPFQPRMKPSDKVARIATNHKAHLERMAQK